MPRYDKLEQFQREHDFFVALDSDGCVFDSMEIKHKECFTPAFIKHWDLQAAAKYARQVWEFSNLYSVDRGMNRFPVLVRSLDLLMDYPEAARRTLRGAGPAIVATSAILAIGFLVLTLASVKSIIYFGLLSAVAMVAALFADLLVLPAILISVKPRLPR